MAFRYRVLRHIMTTFARQLSGSQLTECGQATKLLPLSLIQSANMLENFVASGAFRDLQVSRYSTIAARSKEVPCEVDLFSFIRSTLDDAEGPFHCWLNRFDKHIDFFKKGGGYLLIADAFLDDPAGPQTYRVMLEKVKLLQQRYPWLHIFGFQSCSSISSIADQDHLINVITEEYISFPILMCSKIFPEVASGACCILLKNFTNPPLYNEKEVDFSILDKAIKDLNEQLLKNVGNATKLTSSWSKQIEGFREPYVCSYLRNLPLSYPACISADDSTNRIFLSDSNHHRFLVFDSNGKILDAIGSSPGFEDGDFETAKLMRPAASYYYALENCLYFVDSENHAIRRADLGRRVVETLYPTNDNKGGKGLWTRILDKLGFRRDVEMKSVEFDQDSLLFPWHLLKTEDNELFILNRSFDTLWIMDLGSALICDVVRGQGSIMELCGQLMSEKVSDLKNLSSNCLQQLAHSNHPFGGIPYSGFLSSSVIFDDDLLICDTVGHRVLVLNKQTEVASSIELSDFGILSIPYWLPCPMEGVFPGSALRDEAHFDHMQSFTLFPGRIDVHLTIDIPADTELVEPLHEHCIWRQTKGAAMEVLGLKDTAAASDKVGVAQQWYDDLDNLAFESEPDDTKVENQISKKDLQDDKIHIDCIVNTSPGTSEVIVSAPLYMKLRRGCKDNQEMKATKIADILRPNSSGTRHNGRDVLVHLLLKLNRDLSDLVFMKALNVRITFDTPNHPKAQNSKEIILTDAEVDVNVSL